MNNLQVCVSGKIIQTITKSEDNNIIYCTDQIRVRAIRAIRLRAIRVNPNSNNPYPNPNLIALIALIAVKEIDELIWYVLYIPPIW